MGILDNDTVVVDAILTKIGRQKLANGRPLNITKFGNLTGTGRIRVNITFGKRK